MLLPIQKLSLLALMADRWMGLPERLAMREKGLRVDWRDSSGRGLVEARKGRRDVRARRECIVDGSLLSFLKVACED